MAISNNDYYKILVQIAKKSRDHSGTQSYLASN